MYMWVYSNQLSTLPVKYIHHYLCKLISLTNQVTEVHVNMLSKTQGGGECCTSMRDTDESVTFSTDKECLHWLQKASYISTFVIGKLESQI